MLSIAVGATGGEFPGGFDHSQLTSQVHEALESLMGMKVLEVVEKSWFCVSVNDSTTVPGLSVSYDAGWSTRGSGRQFNSDTTVTNQMQL